MAQINQYTTTATTIEDGSFFDIDQDQGAGVFQSQKVPPALLKEYFDIPLTTVVSLTSAQILAIQSTPIEVLPALGSGLYYEYTAVLKYTYVTTAYIVSGGGALYLNQGSKDCYFDRVTIAQTENAVSTGTFYGFAKINNAITITADSNPTTGDGTAQIVITYRIKSF